MTPTSELLLAEELGEARDAVTVWLRAWHEHDWQAMAGASQQSWRLRWRKLAPEILESCFSLVALQGWEIVEAEPIGSAGCRLTVRLSTADGLHVLRPVAVCEDELGDPTSTGTWGVNPVSGMAGLYR